MSTMPWIHADLVDEAWRWNDELDVSLAAQPVRAPRSSVSGDLRRDVGLRLGETSGRSSVSGLLSLKHRFAGAIVSGKATVSGLIGDLYEYGGSSAGSSAVSGHLLHGQVEMIAGSSSGSTTIDGDYGYDPAPDLQVRKYSHISGSQADEAWGSGSDLPPMGANSGRGDGRTRRAFSPRATGRVSERSTWHVDYLGTDAGGGE
jgi:hypothetical protein